MKTKKLTRRQAIQNQLDRAKLILTEKGYRDYLKRSSTLSTEYFQNGGTFNIKDYEHKPTIKKGNYYDNSEACFECNGTGCKQCSGKGVTRWPLSLIINGCKPPKISQSINKHAIPLRIL
jgi:hypothetical protein